MKSQGFKSMTAASSVAVLLALTGCGDRNTDTTTAGQQVDQAAAQSAEATTEARQEAQQTLTEARQESQQAIQQARQESQEALQEAREKVQEAEQQSQQALQEARDKLQEAQQTSRQALAKAQTESRQAYDSASQEAREQVADLRQETQEASQQARELAEQARSEAREAVQEARTDALEAQREAEQARNAAGDANQAVSSLAQTRDPQAGSADGVRDPATTMGAASSTQGTASAAPNGQGSESSSSMRVAPGSGQPDDEQITTRVNTGLSVNRELNSSSIDVDSDDGVVTLKGKVASDNAKQSAERIARSVLDVKDVKNELEVDSSIQSAASQRPDRSSTASSDAASSTTPSASQDTTRSMGATSADWQRSESSSMSADTQRDSTATIDASADDQRRSLGTTLNDAQITAKVNTGLSVDKDLSAMDIDVTTRDGVVTLEGRAPSEDAKKRADEIARNVEDVQSVRNELKVGGSS